MFCSRTAKTVEVLNTLLLLPVSTRAIHTIYNLHLYWQSSGTICLGYKQEWFELLKWVIQDEVVCGNQSLHICSFKRACLLQVYFLGRVNLEAICQNGHMITINSWKETLSLGSAKTCIETKHLFTSSCSWFYYFRQFVFRF